ncbi:MAG TPA: alpha/beta hydrolase, partial [Beijerinckiaceae bacterium]|nr:alpha/beta hydrolase [Beijerinckiaceae bacterium]
MTISDRAARGRGVDRRSLVATGLGVAVVALSSGRSVAAADASANPMMPVPMPSQAPAKEGMAEIAGKHLYYWDTGGNGTPIVLMHPASGSAFIWGYQQPVLAGAGYRVIAYSRANYRNSDPVPQGDPGFASSDLGDLMTFLGVNKFHAVASAAGCSVTLDFALSHPERLLSMVLSSGAYGGIKEPDYVKAVSTLKVKGLDEMPTFFKELGPSYRAANPDGTRAWADLEKGAKTGNGPDQKSAAKANWATLGALKVPSLFVAGDSDLDAPPSLMRIVAARIPGSEFLAVPESGHSVYWEQSDVFNRAVLDF